MAPAIAAPLPLIFEASIAAQMILFAGVQAASAGRAGSLKPILAVATGSLGLAAGINMLTAIGVWGGLRDLNLLLELACVTASYVYVARAFHGAALPAAIDLWHLAPAGVVFLAWKTGLVHDVDTLMLVVLSVYLASCAAALAKHWPRYQPKPVLAFALLLTASVAVLVVLRMSMMSDAALGLALRESPAYLALLLFMTFVSSAVLLLEFRHPNLLGTPSAHIKYAAGGAMSEAELTVLDERFCRLMREARPFLDPELSVGELAERLSARPREVSQLASRRYGLTVPALLNQWRVDEAARLLTDPSNTLPVTTIMYDAGFGSKSSFQREFQRRFGMSPSAYRARLAARS